MSRKKIAQLLQQRSQLLEEIRSLSHLLHGSWIERYAVCSRKNCKCHNGQRHGPRRCLVVYENGKQRQKYIPNSQVSAALKGLEQFKRMQAIIEEITKINLLLIKEKVYADT